MTFTPSSDSRNVMDAASCSAVATGVMSAMKGLVRCWPNGEPAGMVTSEADGDYRTVNPRTGERITIPGGKVPRFSAGSALKTKVKG